MIIRTDNERAWIIWQWAVRNRTQCEIAGGLALSAGVICNAIRSFCETWTGRGSTDRRYNGERQALARVALSRFIRKGNALFVEPVVESTFHYDAVLAKARKEHALMLRAEGLTYQKIGNALDISKMRASHLVMSAGHELGKAMRRTRFTIT